MIGTIERTGDVYPYKSVISGPLNLPDTSVQRLQDIVTQGGIGAHAALELLEPVATELDKIHKNGIAFNPLPSDILLKYTKEGNLEASLGYESVATPFGTNGRSSNRRYALPSTSTDTFTPDTNINGLTDVQQLAKLYYYAATGEQLFSDLHPKEMDKVSKKEGSYSSEVNKRLIIYFSEPVQNVLSQALDMNQSQRPKTCVEFIESLKQALSTPDELTDVSRVHPNRIYIPEHAKPKTPKHSIGPFAPLSRDSIAPRGRHSESADKHPIAPDNPSGPGRHRRGPRHARR